MLPAPHGGWLTLAENDLSASEPIGVIAGGGSLPRIVAQEAAQAGFTPIIVQIADALFEDWSDFDAHPFAWGRTGDAIQYLKRRGVKTLVFCGTVSRRPDFRSLIPSWRTLRMMPALSKIVRGGDDRLIRSAARYLEGRGFELKAVQEIAPRLLTPNGILSARAPSAKEWSAFSLASQAASAIGELDAGQAAVASSERVIAFEGIEGTRQMMARVGDMRDLGLIARHEHCVLVKVAKKRQDDRFDLPSIGPATVEEAVAAGITGIGVSAGRSLVIGFESVVAAADRSRIALVGLATHETLPGPAS